MQLSNELFYEAVNLKRSGNYSMAIQIYQQEIRKMRASGDFHEFTTYARAMAKCLYLAHDAEMAMKVYSAIFKFNLLTNPNLVNDLKDLFEDKNSDGAQKAHDWLMSWAPEIGYVSNATNTGIYNKDYYDAIAGRTGAEYSRELYLREGWGAIFDMLVAKNSSNVFLKLVDELTGL